MPTAPKPLTSVVLHRSPHPTPAPDAAARPAKPIRRRPGRPPGGQVLADRHQLLAAAEAAIRADGPDITMEAIASGAGVTKPILYRGIGDRDALVAALAEVFVDRINRAASGALTTARTPRARLRSLVSAFIEVVDTNRNLFLFVTAGGSNVDRVGQALRLADRSAVPISQQLAAQRVASGKGPEVALAWSYGLIGTLQFVTLWWLRDATVGSDELVDQVTELLWSGIGAKATPPRTGGGTRP